MLINGIELSTLGIQLFDRILTSNDVQTTQDWLDGDLQPTVIRQQDSFKKMVLRFLVTEQNEENAFLAMSRLTALLKKSTIIFDDMSLQFDVTIDGKTSQERLKNGNFILTVPLKSDYAKGQTEVYTTDAHATDYFYLNVVYYKKGNILLGTEKVLIRASQFTGTSSDTFESLGIDLNKYLPEYYNSGAVSNFINKELNYENLYNLQTLIINYAPTTYSKEVEYFLQNEDGFYSTITSTIVTFTKEDIDKAMKIGQIIDLTMNKPNGYRARTNFTGDFTFDNFMAFSPLQVYYDKIEEEQLKNVLIHYFTENDDGTFSLFTTSTVVVKEGDVVNGTQLKNIINVDAYKPDKYYNSGVCTDNDLDGFIEFNDIKDEYDIKYLRAENIVLVEYYLGEYPSWSRITTATYKIKYNSNFDTATDLIDAVGIDLNKYHTETYENGVIHNAGSINSFEELLSLGVLQVYYKPIEYTLRVSYSQEEVALGYRDYSINDYMFISNPTLAEIIDINALRPEGYIFSDVLSYGGEVSLSALLAASPISIVYVPVEQVRTKSILVKYKQELASAYSTINTSVVTIEESEVGGGIRLSDLINLNAYKPEYYDNGIIDGASSSSMVLFDEIQGTYDVLYLASNFNTQVRYYTDVIDNQNWIGSSAITYRIIDFTTTTTLVDLGLNINEFKPSYCGEGQVQYTGPVTFTALRNLDAIDIIYESKEEPEDPSGIDYPHRVLFLQHNDMGNYENLFPSWTLNHAYINTGVTVPDMSKLTVLCDTMRVFDTEPLYNVNVEDSYLFGSLTPQGSYYIKYVNNTKYKQESLLTGVNTFNVAAGYGTPELVIEETSSEGFSSNTGITASSKDGYSYATLTYTNLVQSNSAPMTVPLYLFACNRNGYYTGGIAGVGMKHVKIYYEDVLIRDMIPVAFYDKIGDKVAPSNCMYDKITQSFFEDARGLNSFNIMDDPDYVDPNPEHMIGCCYVNYYKDETLFNTATIWFRGSDFVNQTFNLYEKLFVDYYQPQYYGSGVITNLDEIGDVTFNNLKNKIVNVVYPSTGHKVVVNYYRDSADAANLIKQDIVLLEEKDFYQVPTFGDLIPIQKYKPDGYVANYSYPENKVTLNRIMQHSPYDIVYTRVENPRTYTTKITYLRKKFGVDILNPENTYENLGYVELTLDETQFADGVYLEDFVNMDAKYPVSPLEGKPFYQSGVPYEWYLKDERLTTPEDLKPEYKVSYEPVLFFIDVNYYTDVVEEENLIASTTWEIKINDWPDDGQFSLVDELPNTYIDKYKPVICGGGRIHEPEKVWTFETLVAAGEISIIYDTLEEPHDPESSMFPSKVIYFTAESDLVDWNIQYPHQISSEPDAFLHEKYPGPYIPYLDLGYTPKEIGRLRMETKAYSLGDGVAVNANTYGAQTDTYLYFLGYYGGLESVKLDRYIGTSKDAYQMAILSNRNVEDGNPSSLSPNSVGWFAFRGHIPNAGFWVYTNPHPQSVDGLSQYNLNTNAFNEFYNFERVRELRGGFRRGYYDTLGNNWEHINTYKDYGIVSYDEDINPQDIYGGSYANLLKIKKTPNTDIDTWKHAGYGIAFNPVTMVVDAYNNYMETYDYSNSRSPVYKNLVNEDIDLFTRRCKPKGSITAFATTNPDSGTVNLNPFNNKTYPALGIGLVGGGAQLGQVSIQNPWDSNFTGSITTTVQVITGTMDDGTPIYENKTTTKNIAYAKNIYSMYPCQLRTMIWYIKIWDRNKLVRNLIPVAKGDQIYDYIAPANGMFDLVTETFFGNQNKGGKYAQPQYHAGELVGMNYLEVTPEEVYPLKVELDPTVWGNIVVNYYDEKNNFLGNQYVEIPVHYKEANTTIYEICHYNDFKPNEFYHDGMIDIDLDLTNPTDATLKAIYDTGSINVYYKLLTYTKTVVYYQGNSRVGSKDLFYSIEDINKAETLADLGIDVSLYQTDDFAPGRIVFNEQVIADDDIKTFIDASSPIVVYDKLTKEENPNLLYLEYYRGGAYDDNLITLDENDPNYLNCNLDAVALNPNGTIKYINHYHSALYEDEKQDYFIAYQVDVEANYVPVHKGPARRYATLAIIVDKGRYTVIEEKEGWGRLKEYPTGWIMLSYTKPVVGPGQNPDYDRPTAEQVTIPFATRLTINRMTVDRLWCYSPEYASWIKAEDISFDQSGKLYNALATEVIHLDQIDWSNVSSIFDMKIFPEAHKLKYHDYCGYKYEGEFTQEAFSAIHSLEFVYPETVYAYNCIYYKDTVSENTELARESFSCSISDWNPDWDIFISTNNLAPQFIEKEKYGLGYITNVDVYGYIIYPEPTNVGVSNPGKIDYHRPVEILGPSVTDADGEVWYHIKNQPYGKDAVIGWVRARYLEILREYSTGYEQTINPTLYRDTPLTLTWDYFGIDRNAYKPAIGNYDDGILLWNPKTYDNGEVRFTFEELVTTGVQSILYVHSLQNYKLVTSNGGSAPVIPISAPFNMAPDAAGNESGITDIEIKMGKYLNREPNTITGGSSEEVILNVGYLTATYATSYNNPTANYIYYRKSTLQPTKIPALSTNRKYVITNVSNKRNNTVVYSYGNDVTGYQSPYFAIKSYGGDGVSYGLDSEQEIVPTLNLTTKDYNLLRPFKYYAETAKDYGLWKQTLIYYHDDYEVFRWKTFNGEQTSSNPLMHYYVASNSRPTAVEPSNNLFSPQGFANKTISDMTAWGTTDSPFYYLKIWKNYYLEHYYVPVARGTWLEDGRQIPYNTIYDIITNTICECPDASAAANNQIFAVGTMVNDENVYNPFDIWNFNYTDCDYVIKTTAAIDAYKYPDVLSPKMTSYPSGSVMPVKRYTADTENKVQGEWYYNGYAWFSSENTTILPTEDFTINEVVPAKELALKSTTANAVTSYKAFLEPTEGTTTSAKTYNTESVVTVMYKCGEFYWVSTIGWIPVQATEENTEDINVPYVVSTGTLKVYNHPIKNDVYQVNTLLSGDRIVAKKKLVRDEEWQYIDNLGWIQANEANVNKLM